MKIIVKGNGQNISLSLPTKLIFSKRVLKLVLKNNRHVSKLEKIPPHAVEALVDELRRVKKKYGTWELVEVDSADGEYVKITL